MRRFFVPAEQLRQGPVTISGDLCRHISTVLRLKPGDAILLADGRGKEAEARITATDKEGISIDIDAVRTTAAADGIPAITLFQGVPKGEKLDLILQKGTELGVERIVPFIAERSVSRLDSERAEKKIQRWERIVMEAARQSKRDSIPAVGFAGSLASALQGDASDLRLLLWEGETEQGLRSVIAGTERPASIAVIVGPEGGLTPAEAARAVAAGFLPVSLGGRILRTETAGLAVISILQYLWGDLG